MVVELILPGRLSDLEQLIYMKQLRRHVADGMIYIADRQLYGDPDAEVVECNSVQALAKIWHLFSQALILGPGKALIQREAGEDNRRSLLDRVLMETPGDAVTRIRWKPSRNGGRPWPTPAATAAQLGASRRKKGATSSLVASTNLPPTSRSTGSWAQMRGTSCASSSTTSARTAI